MAAIVSIFSFELEELGHALSGALSATPSCWVIVGTVAFTGLTMAAARAGWGWPTRSPRCAHRRRTRWHRPLYQGVGLTSSLLLGNNFSQVSENRLDVGGTTMAARTLSEETLMGWIWVASDECQP